MNLKQLQSKSFETLKVSGVEFPETKIKNIVNILNVFTSLAKVMEDVNNNRPNLYITTEDDNDNTVIASPGDPYWNPNAKIIKGPAVYLAECVIQIAAYFEKNNLSLDEIVELKFKTMV